MALKRIAAVRNPLYPHGWAHGDRGTIIMVTGFNGIWTEMIAIANFCNSLGFRIELVSNQVTHFGKIDDVAQLIKIKVESFPRHEKIFLLGHSKGGLAARVAYSDPVIAKRIAGLITVATPWGGIKFNSSLLNISEFTIGSSLCEQLQSEKSINANVYNFYPAFDPVVSPNSSLVIAGGINKLINTRGHTLIMESPELFNEIQTLIS